MPFCILRSAKHPCIAPFKVQLKIMMGEKNENHSIHPNFIVQTIMYLYYSTVLLNNN